MTLETGRMNNNIEYFSNLIFLQVSSISREFCLSKYWVPIGMTCDFHRHHLTSTPSHQLVILRAAFRASIIRCHFSRSLLQSCVQSFKRGYWMTRWVTLQLNEREIRPSVYWLTLWNWIKLWNARRYNYKHEKYLIAALQFCRTEQKRTQRTISVQRERRAANSCVSCPQWGLLMSCNVMHRCGMEASLNCKTYCAHGGWLVGWISL